MSEQERLELRERLNEGLKESFESMLRKKAQLNKAVIISDGAGNPVEVPANELLAKYLAEQEAHS
jgi:hypothetical protein